MLDSRPLGETLTVFLDQRWKSLQNMLGSDKSKSPTSPFASRSNGIALPNVQSQPRKTARQVKDLVLTSLDAVSRTVKVAREVFQDKESKPSTIRAALEFIQSDGSQNESLPKELQLSTQSILAGLPSSAQFQMLPQSLRSYKPYVDSSSASSSLSNGSLHKHLDEWFQKAIRRLKTSFDTWLVDIQNVKVLWAMRSSVRSWMDSFDGLEEAEVGHLKSVFDEVCRTRILDMWKSTLSEAEISFRTQMTSAISSFKTEGARTGM
jgi:conserved oligomeric Golgi complex subunit 1